MMPRTKRILIASALTLVLLTGAAGLYIQHVVDSWPQPPESHPFDRTVWLANAGRCEEGNPRGQMTVDLQRRFAKTGLNRSEVRQLLGPGDLSDTPHLLSYHIGMWTGFHWDCDSFDVRFDSAGRVVDAIVIQH